MALICKNHIGLLVIIIVKSFKIKKDARKAASQEAGEAIRI